MTKPSSPRRSAPDARIFAFVETLLDQFFLETDGQAKYERLARGGRRARAKAGEIVSIGSLELADQGAADLSVRVGSPEIIVKLVHPRFNADIVAHYDVNAMAMTEARVDRFEGDRKQAAKCADIWYEDLVLGEDDEFGDLDDALEAFPAGDESPFANENDAGEPTLTAADTAMVNALATSLAREMRRKNPDMMAHHDELLALEDAPQTLWPILDGLVAACTAVKRDESLIDAWRFLLDSQLTLIRYRIDRGWEWATRMVEDYQDKLIGIGQAKRVSPEDFSAMAGALGEARIEVKPEVRRALADAGLSMPEPRQPRELSKGMAAMMTDLTNQMASLASTPFEVDAAISEATQVMPPEIRSFMAHEFARSTHPVVRDAVALMLLSSDQEVRRTAAAALEQTAVPGTMSPETLRRMITIRNWVPEADRPPIDQAIRAARLKLVDCAQWPPALDLVIAASIIDGSGAQNVILTGRGGRKGVLAGVLLKLDAGVADSWCETDTPRREINEVLTALRRSGEAREVRRSYLDTAIQHAIAKGAEVGQPPGGAVLRIAELAGGESWRARRLDVAEEANRLFDALPEAERSPAAIEASLTRSGAWIDKDFADSWFLDDADVRGIVGRGARRDTARLVHRLMTEALPERRAEWAERFLLLALRVTAMTDRVDKTFAGDFAILARALSGDRDMATIPLMVAIAKYTVETARLGRW